MQPLKDQIQSSERLNCESETCTARHIRLAHRVESLESKFREFQCQRTSPGEVIVACASLVIVFALAFVLLGW